MSNERFIVTCGNPNGIGPEVTASALLNLPSYFLERALIITDPSTRERYFADPIFSNSISLVDGAGFQCCPGVPSSESGAVSYKYLLKAMEIIDSESCRALVTAPLSKEHVIRSGYSGFLDHTHFLAEHFRSEQFSMLFASEDICVTLATIHLPLSQVSEALTGDCVRNAINNALAFNTRCGFLDRPVAVCGLNPHAGESGILGMEEKKVIRPIIEEFRAACKPVEGPFPADTLFYKALRGDYRMVVAMYHDQGLAPFKMLHMNDGVNITMGLPIVRTSPDHGTAFDIAGKGRADPGSMKQAFLWAQRLTDGPAA